MLKHMSANKPSFYIFFVKLETGWFYFIITRTY